MPSSDSSRDVLLERLAEDFVERHRRGECPSLSEYIALHPELSADIRELFPALVQIEQLKPAAGELTTDQPPDVPRLERLGDYRILREVGRGGMGVVYEAEQESLGRHVALKVLPPHALLSGTYLERFRREARAAAKLHHTNIVPVFGVGEIDGVHFYAMQFIRGEPLDKVLADLRQLRKGDALSGTGNGVISSLITGIFAPASDNVEVTSSTSSATLNTPRSALSTGLSSAEYYRSVARLGVQVAEALAHAHKQGILHRDIKPSNLLLDAQGRVWITDFGLAKAEGNDELTQTGDVVGTLRFMAPERFEGQSLPQSDIYALGLTLYELLTLQPAFSDKIKAKLIDKILHEPVNPVRTIDPQIPLDLETIVLKSLAKEPAERYTTAEALAEDLERFVADRPIAARRSTPTERLWRWCRRNPRLATLTLAVGVLLLTVAIVSTTAAVWLNAALGDARTQRNRAALAELEQKRKVYEGHVTEAKFRRFSRVQGQRFGSLNALRAAMELLPQLELDDEVQKQRQILRDLAISCLTLPDMRAVREWEGWPEGSYALALDDHGEWYARTDNEGNVIVRRTSDDGEVYCLKDDGKPALLLFAPNSRLLVLWRSDNTIEGRHLPDGRVAFRLREAGSPYMMRISNDGRTFASCLLDGTLTLYSLPDGAVRRRMKLVSPEHPKIELSPDGESLAVISGPYHNPFSLAKLSDEQRLKSRCVAHIFPVFSHEPPHLLHHTDVISSLAWYPDSRTLAAGGTNNSNEIFIWDVPSGKKLAVITSQKGGAPHLNINRTGDMLVSQSGWNGGVKMWNPHTLQELLTLPRSVDHFHVPAADGRLFARETSGTKLRMLECVPGQVYRAFVRDLRAEKARQYFAVALHPDGRLLAAGMEGGVVLWDLPSGSELGFLPIDNTESVRFESSGALWTYGKKGLLRWPVRLQDNRAAKIGPPQTLSPTPTFGVHIDISRDGSVVAAGVATRPALVLHRSRPGQIIRLDHRGDVRSLAVSPDGRYVVTWSFGAPPGFTVWDADSGKVVTNLFPKEVGGANFTGDGRWLVINSHWLEVGTWKEFPGVEGWTVRGGCMSGDGSLLAMHHIEEGIKLFDKKSGRLLARLVEPRQGRIWEMTFSRDGTRLFGIDHDNLHVQAWDLRKLRAELREIGLDWDAPDFPPEGDLSRDVKPVEIFFGNLAFEVILGLANPAQ